MITDIINDEFIKTVITKRDRMVHKGDMGRILVLAGYGDMPGAAVFSSRAALRSGSGLVYTCTAPGSVTVLNTIVPEAIVIDWNTASHVLSGDHDPSGRHLKSYDAVCIGPGMGISNMSKRMLKTVLLSYSGPLVIDADALNLISASDEFAEWVRAYTGDIIMTPHEGEAARLLAHRSKVEACDDYTERRLEIIKELVDRYNCITVLKGAETLVARPFITASGNRNIEIWRNGSGNPGMATAGSGDVLTGVITSLLGQGICPWEATRAAVYLHGLAGDLASEVIGEYGLIATDIIEFLPRSFNRFV